MKVRAFLFDLDDTILDEGDAEEAWRAACERAAGGEPRVDAEALLVAIGRARAWYWSDPERHREGRLDLRAARSRLVAMALGDLGLDRSGLADCIADAYGDLRDAAVRPFPGAVETLERLNARGLLLALVSNGGSAAQRAKIERFGLSQYFQRILIEGEFGVGKPDERIFRAAMQGLGVAPVEAAMVGDNLDWDVAAAQGVGLFGVWVDSSGAGLPAASSVRPDLVIRALPELLGSRGLDNMPDLC